MGVVIEGGFCTTNDIDPETVLEAAKGKYKHVLLIGRKADGKLDVCSSTSYVPNILHDLERTKVHLLDITMQDTFE